VGSHVCCVGHQLQGVYCETFGVLNYKHYSVGWLGCQPVLSCASATCRMPQCVWICATALDRNTPTVCCSSHDVIGKTLHIMFVVKKIKRNDTLITAKFQVSDVVPVPAPFGNHVQTVEPACIDAIVPGASLFDRNSLLLLTGFCHWPQPAWRRADGTWVPSQANFTSLASPDAIGSGKTVGTRCTVAHLCSDASVV
jgi:hypothetical protein